MAAVNLSSGYYNEHRLHEHINLAEMQYNIRRVLQMVNTPCGVFQYETAPAQHRRNRWGGYCWRPQETRPQQVFLMKLPEDASVRVGKLPLRKADFYLSESGEVYRYLAALDAAILTEQAKAYDSEGKRLKFSRRSQPTRWVSILSFAQAMELLQTV